MTRCVCTPRFNKICRKITHRPWERVVDRVSWGTRFVLSLLSFSSIARGADWPTLGAAMERARAAAPAVVDAERQLGVARAARAGATVSWIANPYVEIQTYKASSTKDLAFQSFATFPIEINGQRPSRIREADALERWKSLTREEVRARAVGIAVALYGDALVARAKVDLAVRAETDAKAEADLYAARLAAGDATAVDRSLADAELARWAQQHAEAQLLAMTAKQQLEVVLALEDIGDPPAGNADPPPLRAPTPEALAAIVRERAPQVRSFGAEASFWRQSSDRASRDKNVPLAFIVNFGRNDLGDFQAGGGIAWTFPITQRAQGPVAMADASAERADSLKRTSEQFVSTQARRLFEQYDVLRTTLDALDRTGLPAQERVVDASVGAYRAGKIDFLRVLSARRDLAQARSRRLDLVLQAWHRLGELASIIGALP